MRMVAVICGMAALLAVPATVPLMAQDQPPTDQNQTSSQQTKPVTPKPARITPKFELSAGYAHRSYYSQSGATLGMNGLYVSFEDNLKRWIGIDADISGTTKNQNFLFGDTRIYTFLAGPQFYPLGHRKVTPFGHIFFGAGYYSNHIPAFGGFGPNTTTSLAHMWQGGGGIDVNLTQHWGVRAIQVDVGGANFFSNSSSYTNRSMVRVSVGVVYRWGQR